MKSSSVSAIFVFGVLSAVVAVATNGDDSDGIVDVFTSKNGAGACPRIPAIVATNNGSLLAFCEGRRTSCGDGSAKSLTLSRSVDGGLTWSDPVFIVGGAKDIIGQPMPVVDRSTGDVIVQYISSKGSAIGNCNWQIRSSDDGLTWMPPQNISKFFGKYVGIMNGPGNAIQLDNGRLMFAGHYGPYQFDLVWWSDDGGKTYEINTQKMERMDEIALVQLNNKSIMLNMRNSYAHARGVAISNDGGQTFGSIRIDEALVSPVCQGSIVRVDDTLYFSNPNSKTARANITVKRSYDDGETWPLEKQTLIWADKGPGYSCLVDGGIPISKLASTTSANAVKKGGILFERTVDGKDCVSFKQFDL